MGRNTPPKSSGGRAPRRQLATLRTPAARRSADTGSGWRENLSIIFPVKYLHISGGPLLQSKRGGSFTGDQTVKQKRILKVYDLNGDFFVFNLDRIDNLNELFTAIEDILQIRRHRIIFLFGENTNNNGINDDGDSMFGENGNGNEYGLRTKTKILKTPFQSSDHEMDIQNEHETWCEKNSDSKDEEKEEQLSKIRNKFDKDAIKSGKLQIVSLDDLIKDSNEVVVTDEESEAWASPELIKSSTYALGTKIRLVLKAPKTTRNFTIKGIEINVRTVYDEEKEFLPYEISRSEHGRYFTPPFVCHTYDFIIRKKDMKGLDFSAGKIQELRYRFIFNVRGIGEKMSNWSHCTVKVKVKEQNTYRRDQPEIDELAKTCNIDSIARKVKDPINKESGNVLHIDKDKVIMQKVCRKRHIDDSKRVKPRKAKLAKTSGKDSTASDKAIYSAKFSKKSLASAPPDSFSDGIDLRINKDKDIMQRCRKKSKKRHIDVSKRVQPRKAKLVKTSEKDSTASDKAKSSVKLSKKSLASVPPAPKISENLSYVKKAQVEFFLSRECDELQEYVNTFLEDGYDCMESIRHDLDEDALKVMKIRPGHRKRIMRAIGNLKKQEATNVSILCCPITGTKFQNPHRAADGQVYEYAAIKEWFASHDRSPCTNSPISKELVKVRQVGSGWLDNYESN